MHLQPGLYEAASILSLIKYLMLFYLKQYLLLAFF
jgi:hypothetical protein